jgi:release factor glutamine methyltransferase
MTFKKIYELLLRACACVYEQREAENISKWLTEELFGLRKQDFEREILVDENFLFQLCERIRKAEPPQYIAGVADFYGRKLCVSPHVLIPRPETEEIIFRIKQKYSRKAALRILDIGTGSGCLALTLAAEFPNSSVFALDVSSDALSIAEKNQKAWALNNVKFIEADFLNLTDEFFLSYVPHFDLIVSNPPYIGDEEKSLMAKNVLDYEPHLALFAPGDDVLIFYKKTAETGAKILAPHGEIYTEIHENYAQNCLNIFEKNGFEAAIIKDLQQKERMICARFAGKQSENYT